jgi:hypothetical protein
MKNTALAILLLVPALVWAQKPAPSQADFSITVHVQSSRVVDSCFGNPAACGSVQRLTVSIDGKKYELEGPIKGAVDVLRVGDYKAKIAKDETKQAYEYRRVYEFLFADGITREYKVVGEGE